MKQQNKPWMILKDKVRKRDSETCQICGRVWKKEHGRHYDVHHLIPEQDGWLGIKYTDVAMVVLITLCHKCHANVKRIKKMLVDCRHYPWKSIYPKKD